jgi:hypothetical protein
MTAIAEELNRVQAMLHAYEQATSTSHLVGSDANAMRDAQSFDLALQLIADLETTAKFLSKNTPDEVTFEISALFSDLRLERSRNNLQHALGFEPSTTTASVSKSIDLFLG